MATGVYLIGMTGNIGTTTIASSIAMKKRDIKG